MLPAMPVGPSCLMLQNSVSGSARVPGGGGGAQRNFIWGGSSPMSDPLPCYKPFLTGKAPIWYNFHWQIVSVL